MRDPNEKREPQPRHLLNALVVPALVLGISAINVPLVEAADLPKKAGHAQIEQSTRAIDFLKRSLSSQEIESLEASYEHVYAELDQSMRKLDPLRKIPGTDWGKILNDWNGAKGKDLNSIVSFQLQYDGVAALRTMAELTGKPKWSERADRLAHFIADTYILPTNGRVAGYRNHSTGLTAAAISSKDPTLLKAASEQTENAIYVELNPTTSKEIISPFLSRETALGVLAILNAAELDPHHAVKKSLLDSHMKALEGHLTLWAEALANPGKDLPSWPKTVSAENQGLSAQDAEQVQQTYVRPFMVALSAIAAARAKEADPKYASAAKQANLTLHAMEKLWKDGSRAFPYTDRPFPKQHKLTQMSDGLTTEDTPDLNGIIGGAYIRVGLVTKDPQLTAFGLKVFKAGLNQMYTGGKQLNQALNPFAEPH